MHAVSRTIGIGPKALYGNTIDLRLPYRKSNVVGQVFQKDFATKRGITYQKQSGYKRNNSGDRHEFDDRKTPLLRMSLYIPNKYVGTDTPESPASQNKTHDAMRKGPNGTSLFIVSPCAPASATPLWVTRS